MVPELLQPFVGPAIASHKKYFPRGPFVSVILSQLIIESDWGRKVSGAFNYFGIKATENQIAAGKFKLIRTREFISGRYVIEDLEFASYDSIEECFDAHGALLTSPHYARCVAASNVVDYCYALRECGYATAPNYPTALITCITDYDLTQFDGE
jgi:flagellum-specific peptidoglycan hydrolase FlgJ